MMRIVGAIENQYLRQCTKCKNIGLVTDPPLLVPCECERETVVCRHCGETEWSMGIHHNLRYPTNVEIHAHEPERRRADRRRSR